MTEFVLPSLPTVFWLTASEDPLLSVTLVAVVEALTVSVASV